MAKGTWIDTHTGKVYSNTNQLVAALRSYMDYIRTAHENDDNIKYLALAFAPALIRVCHKNMKNIQM